MTGAHTSARRLAHWLMRCAARLMPGGRAEWADSMRAELDYVAHDSEALLWALGCVLSGIRERMVIMKIGGSKISRPVLIAEMMLCFAPLTLGWLGIVFSPFGVAGLDARAIEAYLDAGPGGVAALVVMYSAALLGVAGPVALALAFRFLVLGRSIRSPPLAAAIVAAPIVLGAMYVASNAVIGARFAADDFAEVALFFVLPALGAAHLLRLSTPPAEGAAA